MAHVSSLSSPRATLVFLPRFTRKAAPVGRLGPGRAGPAGCPSPHPRPHPAPPALTGDLDSTAAQGVRQREQGDLEQALLAHHGLPTFAPGVGCHAGISLFSDQFVCLAVGSAYISCKLQKGKSCHWPPVTLESLISNLPGTEVITTLTRTQYAG